MRASAAIAALILVAGSVPAAADRLIATLSTSDVKITSNFTGTSVTVFGAIERDPGSSPRPEEPVIVVAVRGPPQTVITRRKEPWLGLWINRSARTLPDAPAFYALRSTRPLGEVAGDVELEKYQIGLAHIALGPPGAPPDEFERAFLRLKEQAGLYSEQSGAVDMPGAGIFQATVQIPANVPVGLYTATVYLFENGSMVTRADGNFTIAKSGFEQFMFTLAHQRSLFYGVAPAVLALIIGWLAGVIFRRD
jgi:uncharacterized protein (TIGR02186 family)